MPTMPEKAPTLWTALLAWLVAHQPQLYAAGLSVAIAALRVVYAGIVRGTTAFASSTGDPGHHADANDACRDGGEH